MKLLDSIKNFFNFEKPQFSLLEYRDISTNEVLFDVKVYGGVSASFNIGTNFPVYIPSNGTIIKKSGNLYKVMKTYSDFDRAISDGKLIIIWLKEIPDD